MNKVLKTFILFLCIALLVGCKKNNSNTNLLDNIEIEDLGLIQSDMGGKAILLKAKNNNDVDVTLYTTATILNNKKEVSNEINYVTMYPSQEIYYIVEISSPDEYDEYKLVHNVAEDIDYNYEKVYKNLEVKKNNQDEKEGIGFTIKNDNDEKTRVQVLGLFYKDEKIVGASATEIIVENKREDIIYIPVDNAEDYNQIEYTNVDIFVSKVGIKTN